MYNFEALDSIKNIENWLSLVNLMFVIIDLFNVVINVLFVDLREEFCGY